MTDEGDHPVRTSPGRGRQAIAVSATTVLLLAACSDAVPDTADPAGTEAPDAGAETGEDSDTATPGGDATPGDDAGSTGNAGPAPEGLEEFYEQELAWSDCEGGECAELTVPIDYTAPDGETIQIALLRVPAEGERIGALVVNPGGPGSSGVDYAQSAGLAFGEPLRAAYDIVGFDPRGVARSAPIECVDDAGMDEFLGADPTPDDPGEEEEVQAIGRGFAEACQERAGALLGHVSTVEAARDMDVLRAALGEDALDYLGASYGTFLGATYAELFPDRVGRMVLDGAVDPTLTGAEPALGQAEGFQRATEAYVESCVSEGDCPLGDDVDAALDRIPAFLAELDDEPIPVDGDAVTELTEGWGSYGIIVAMYDPAGWPILTQAFRQAFDGDGSLLMLLANLYAQRDADGSYQNNGQQAFYAVNCLEAGEMPDEDEEELLRQFREVSPTWGEHLLTMDHGVCEDWPLQPQEVLEDYAAEGSDPIVVIGTTGDPATPYEWAEGLADVLDAGVLLTYEGEGHTAYGRSNDCVDDAVHTYLIDGTVPQDGLTC
jgi:pimeloyl-ACP methyl ester carboxylesterase